MSYNPSFLNDFIVPLPTLDGRLERVAYLNGTPIEHSRFSFVFHSQRDMAIYVAHHLDGDSLIEEGEIPRKDQFRLDPKVPKVMQIDNDRGYVNNPWERGHLASRRAMHWGEREAAELADRESFFWTNIAPQHERLQDTAWTPIEEWLLNFADDNNKRASIFVGPIFGEDDATLINKEGEAPIQIPAGFWKIVALVCEGKLRATGFIVWQRDYNSHQPAAFTPFLEQVRISTIEFLTQLQFGDLRFADPLRIDLQEANPNVPLHAMAGRFIRHANDVLLEGTR